MNCIDFAFLDSGTGGIPYMLALKEVLPDAKCVYLGDTAHFPYGQKSNQEVTDCASEVIQTIVRTWNPKAVVIACNTISVTALEPLRKLFPSLPIIGTVPAVKLAAKVTRNKRIGLLATNATVNHPYCQKLVDDFASDCTVIKRGDPELVSFIEKKLFTSTEEERLEAVRPAAEFFASYGCDTVILGCTHFTHIASEMKKACGAGVTVIDSRDGVARQAARQLEKVTHLENGTSDSAQGTGQSSPKDSSQPQKQEEKFSGSPSSISDLTFFVTAATEDEIREYKSLCKNMNIPWGGVL